jgi:cell wall-associated NlpC family hydrolase
MDSRVVLYDYAMRLVGLPYRWGGDDTVDGFDCSGLVQELLKAAGVLTGRADHTAAALAALFPETLEPGFGSLVFFGSGAISHVGFCLNNLLMLEAGGGGSKTLTEKDAAAQNAYVRVRPIRARTDIVGYRHPQYPWKG